MAIPWFMRGLVVLSFFGLISCQKANEDQILKRELPVIKTNASTAIAPGVAFYPVSPTSSTALPSKVDIVPPGEDLTPHNLPRSKRARTHTKQVAQKESTAPPTFKGSMKTVWRTVGAALKKTRYTIVDKDRSMHVYYVLDRKQTGGRLTHKTPIYRLAMTQHKKQVRLSLVDEHEKALPPSLANDFYGALMSHVNLVRRSHG